MYTEAAPSRRSPCTRTRHTSSRARRPRTSRRCCGRPPPDEVLIGGMHALVYQTAWTWLLDARRGKGTGTGRRRRAPRGPWSGSTEGPSARTRSRPRRGSSGWRVWDTWSSCRTLRGRRASDCGTWTRCGARAAARPTTPACWRRAGTRGRWRRRRATRSTRRGAWPPRAPTRGAAT